MKRFWLTMILAAGVGAIGGLGIGVFAPDLGQTIDAVGVPQLLIIGGLSLVASLVLHIIIHECGHLGIGLLSGYRFISFRIFNLMVVKNSQGGLDFKLFSLPGTAGQCLLAPPRRDSENFPYKGYLLGGILANGMACLICWLSGNISSIFGAVFFFIGLLSIVTNGIPMQFNDGKTLQLAAKSPENRELLYNSLEVNGLLARGMSYTQLPEKLFDPVAAVPEYSYFNTQHDLIRVNRCLEAQEFIRAKILLEELWQKREQIAVPILVAGVAGELLAVLCLLTPADPRIAELWQDKTLQQLLRQPLMGNYRIKALYQKSIMQDSAAATGLLTTALNAQDKMPTAGDAEMETKLCSYLLKHWQNEAA